MIKFNEVTWYSKLAAIIFFLAVLPILCFYIGVQYEVAKEINIPVPLATNLPVNNTSQQSKYINQEYGFSFTYPKDHIVVELSPESFDKTVSYKRVLVANKKEYEDEETYGDGQSFFFSINVFNNINDINLLDWAKENKEFSQFYNTTQNYKHREIAGKDALVYEVSGNFSKYEYIIFKNGSHIYSIQYPEYTDTISPQLIKIEKDILSSFSFESLGESSKTGSNIVH